MRGLQSAWLAAVLGVASGAAVATTVEFNSSGGSTSTNGLHFYIEDTTHMQVRRLNNTGQVYSPTATPPSTSLDNGVFIRGNGKLYGPSESVYGLTPSGGMYNTHSIGTVSPPNPSSSGVQQTATGNFGVTNGPQVSVVWSYTTPLDFMTATVTLTIPATYPISASNPVRYYHVVDNYFGGSDSGCGVSYVDSNGKRVIGSYPPPSGNSCPSQTTVPSGVSVFEFFRERSGLAFSEYCSSLWSDFFGTGGSNCSVAQSAVMSKTVNASYEDTGLGIEFDFTAAGTYTFSYDFVVGSPQVPPYDHLEIQHDGATTLCPDTVTVSACTVATVPCPIANLVNTGTLTGNVTVTPSSPAVTMTPTTFTLGSTATTATVSLQGSGAGSYTLGVANPSSVPLSGTKCWNTATSSQSCAFAISNVACVANFDCIETSVAYSSTATRSPLYTKLAGTGFKFDVVALKSDKTVLTTYAATSNVKIELFDDSASPQPACTAYTSPIATQSITFAAADSGRKTVPNSITVANAYRKVRCRVTDSNMTPNVAGCSSDDFAIRPTSLSVASVMNADLTNGSNATATPTQTAGGSFQLTAAGVLGYNGTPGIDNTNIQAHAGAIAAGTVSGSFLAADPTTGIATGNSTGTAFAYSEVGYFRFLTDGVYDSTFTAVDQIGDCTNDFSNALVSGKYGCKFGNTSTTDYFGRFIPDHFDTPVTPGCAAGAFTYSAQPFTVDVTARNAGGATTQNYKGSFARAVTLSDANSASNNSTTLGSLANTAVAATTFSSGVASVSTIAYTFNTKTTAPLRTVTGSAPMKLHATEPASADGVASSSGIEGTTAIWSGQLRLSSVYGYVSPLKVPVEAQYWTGNSWVRNATDSCTTLAASDLLLNPTGWTITAAPGTLTAGSGFITLTPTGAGQTVVCADLGSDNGVSCSASAAKMPWLQSKWPGGSGYNNDPSAVATFGVFSPEGKRGVYNREMY